MARTSRIEPVRKYLIKLEEETILLKNTAVATENYGEAEIYKLFIESLQKVIQLCGEIKHG
mgnify:FL=1